MLHLKPNNHNMSIELTRGTSCLDLMGNNVYYSNKCIARLNKITTEYLAQTVQILILCLAVYICHCLV